MQFGSLMHDVGQLGEAPQVYGAQLGLPAAPVVTTHVPCELQVLHAPTQSLSQHRRSAQ